MNAELIRLSRKVAKEWAGTDGYNQASHLIGMLCDELEATAPDEPLMPNEKACRSIAKHVFRDHRKDKGGKLAMTAFSASSLFVKQVTPIEAPQVYEV